MWREADNLVSKTRVVHVDDNVPEAVYIGHAVPERGLPQSKWYNPYQIGPDDDRAAVLAKYRKRQRSWMLYAPAITTRDLGRLAGKPLACWCRHDGEERTDGNTCHGDMIIALIEELGLEGNAAT